MDNLMPHVTGCAAYWKQTREALKECDQKLEELLQNCTTEADARELKVATVARSHKNSFGFDLQQEALRFYEVDLCTIPAVSSSTLAVLMSEVGPRADLLKHFANAQAFSSWLCLCPENRITGGKVFAAKTRPTSNRLSTALRMAAMALGHSKTELGNFCRRMKARLGKAEGITAAAHKLARIIYTMIVTRQSYDESKAFALSPRKQARQLANLRRQATRLGFALVPTTC